MAVSIGIGFLCCSSLLHVVIPPEDNLNKWSAYICRLYHTILKMSQLHNFPLTKLALLLVLSVSCYFSWFIAGSFYCQLLIMNTNRGAAGEFTFWGQKSCAGFLSWLMTVSLDWSGWKRETRRQRNPERDPFGRGAALHPSVPCSNARHVTLPFALACQSQHSIPVWIWSATLAFDFALHLCTSRAIKHQGERDKEMSGVGPSQKPILRSLAPRITCTFNKFEVGGFFFFFSRGRCCTTAAKFSDLSKPATNMWHPELIIASILQLLQQLWFNHLETYVHRFHALPVFSMTL